MANSATIALWVIGIALAILVLVGAVVYAAYTIIQPNNSDIINGKPYCSEITANLPDISNQDCCQGEGNMKYNLDIKVDMSPSVISYQAVCKQFCAGNYNLDTDTCTDDTPSNIALVNNCLAAMKPDDCIGQAQPLAVSNGTLYYGLRADLSGCTGVPCVV